MLYAVIVLLLLAATKSSLGQSVDPGQAIRAAMEPSLVLQRASVRKQVEAARQVEAGAAAHPFFTVPWTLPVAMPAAPGCDPLPAGQANALIQSASTREGVPEDLLRAVIGKESAFRPCAVSPKGAQGLMQLMPSTAAMLRVEDPFDPRQNIDAGTRLLRSLIDRYSGDLALALSAYNAGPGAVARYSGVPPYPETVNYVSEILSRAQ